VRPTDLHRPFIDELTRPNPDDPTGQSTMRRITDVLDVWFDSGSMPFAQVHYPFENQEWFDSHSPSDFIVELGCCFGSGPSGCAGHQISFVTPS
ncbi:MAG: hypothetical protein RLZZ600_1124, partial [Actinomycetota bacterium]